MLPLRARTDDVAYGADDRMPQGVHYATEGLHEAVKGTSAPPGM